MGVESKVKTNPNILESHDEEDANGYPTGQAKHNQSSGASNAEQAFMGKRNQAHAQATAPTANAKKGKANTINVEELEGGPAHNAQPYAISIH